MSQSDKPSATDPVLASNENAGRIVLGIDPGTARLGYAAIRAVGNELALMEAGVIATPPHIAMHLRLRQIYHELTALISRLSPTEVAVEELFFAKNSTTAIGVGQARGIALLAAAEGGLTVSEYKPMQVKQAVHGYGLATKAQVGEMVRTLLRLPAPPHPDDAADAAAIAICHLHSSHLTALR